MKFQSKDGDEFTGRSYKAVVQAMADTKFDKPRSLESYRRSVARRTKTFYDYDIETDTDEKFVKSLESHGLLVRLP